MFSQIKLYATSAALIIIIGLSATVYVQHGRNKILRAELAQALAANEASDNAIKMLIADMAKADKSCERRVKDKDRLIAELRNIDETEGGAHEQAGNGDMDNAGTGDTGGRDALLGLLNGMLPAEGGQAGGVCQASGPAGASGAPLVSGDVLYCVDAVNAKNLLKDWALCRAWANEGVAVIDGLGE